MVTPSVIRSFSTVLRFVDAGGLGTASSELNIGTTESVLNDLPLARDKRSYVWTVVGHLQQALGELERELLRKTPGGIRAASARWYVDIARHEYATALLAASYEYLKEYQLRAQAISHHDRVRDDSYSMNAIEQASKDWRKVPLGLAQLAINLTNPGNWVELVTGDNDNEEQRLKHLTLAVKSLS